MSRIAKLAAAAGLAIGVLGLTACGNTMEERVATGALGGAAVGTATSGSLSGAVVGGALGAGAGYAYDRYKDRDGK